MQVGLSLIELVKAKLNVRQGVLEAGAVCKSEERVWLQGVCAECAGCMRTIIIKVLWSVHNMDASSCITLRQVVFI